MLYTPKEYAFKDIHATNNLYMCMTKQICVLGGASAMLLPNVIAPDALKHCMQTAEPGQAMLANHNLCHSTRCVMSSQHIALTHLANTLECGLGQCTN